MRFDVADHSKLREPHHQDGRTVAELGEHATAGGLRLSIRPHLVPESAARTGAAG